MAWLTAMCAMFCGLLLFGVALFGTVSNAWLPDTASHVVLGAIAVGSFIHGVRP